MNICGFVYFDFQKSAGKALLDLDLGFLDSTSAAISIKATMNQGGQTIIVCPLGAGKQ